MNTQESRFLKTGNSMVGGESMPDERWELTDDGRIALRADLAFYLTHEGVEEYDGIENAALYIEQNLEEDDSGLFYELPKSLSRTGEVVHLYYCDGEVQEA